MCKSINSSLTKRTRSILITKLGEALTSDLPKVDLETLMDFWTPQAFPFSYVLVTKFVHLIKIIVKSHSMLAILYFFPNIFIQPIFFNQANSKYFFQHTHYQKDFLQSIHSVSLVGKTLITLRSSSIIIPSA